MGGGEIGTNICSVHHPIQDVYRFLNDLSMFFCFSNKKGKPAKVFILFFNLLAPPRIHCRLLKSVHKYSSNLIDSNNRNLWLLWLGSSRSGGARGHKQGYMYAM